MIPKSGELFTHLTDNERTLFGGERFEAQYPWETLRTMMTFMESLMEQARQAGKDTWPEAMPLCDVNSVKESSNIEIDHAVHIRGGEGLRSDPQVLIIGPVVLGKNVKIRKGAVITGPAYIGDNVLIGQGCRVKCSIIRADTEIRFGTRVAHSVIGRSVFIGSGVSIDDAEIPIRTSSQEITYGVDLRDPIKTGFRELGVTIGDGCQIGGGAGIAPGVILRPCTLVHPLVRIMKRQVYSGRVMADPDPLFS